MVKESHKPDVVTPKLSENNEDKGELISLQNEEMWKMSDLEWAFYLIENGSLVEGNAW